MLFSLSIRNFAIIDRLDVEFGPGLNVLTGETGAGKSVLIGALNAILGARCGSEMVRADADRAVVDAVFDLGDSSAIAARVEELGFELEDDRLFLTREIGQGGRSSARIGGRPAAVGQLKELGDWLVDLHGQHEHQSLLSAGRHLDVLDAWGGAEVLAERLQVAETYRTLQELRAERAGLETDARERARLIDLYRFQSEEIAAAALAPGEDCALAVESRRLANAQRLAECAGGALDALSGGDSTGVLEALAGPIRALEEAAALDDSLAPIVEAFTGARYELDEAARDLAKYVDAVEYNPERLEQVEERLDTIRGLLRKYGNTIDEVIEFGRDVADKLEALGHSEERGYELDEEIARCSAQLVERCAGLSDRRRKLAAELARAVEAELADLAMERTRFAVQVDPIDPTATGADRVELMIAPNPGEPLRPLARIASGGEVSRVMLAIKGAMSRREPLPTMVFDEIDVGVGGRTATVIAEKLAALSRSAQVLCITHLPQIASRGDQHFYIEKREQDGRTVAGVTELTAEGRVDEIARMLGGAEVTDTVMRHARELLHAG